MDQHRKSFWISAGLWRACWDFGRDTSGATAVEYGVMVGFISVAILGTLGAIGTSISEVFTVLSTTLNPPAE